MPRIENLKALHRSHVMSIPFESLDVTYKRKIKLDIDSIFKKIVFKNRGGYCFEQNHLFYHLLSELGFECQMVSSRIYNEGLLGPEFDHMSLVVHLDEPWLVDVGYGDLFIEPIKLVPGLIQEDQFKQYIIEALADGQFLLLESLKGSNDFVKKYLFDLTSRKIGDYLAQNRVKQIDADSYFVKNRICTLPTVHGRKTLFNNTFKERHVKNVTVRKIVEESEYLHLLEDAFGIKINLK